MSIKIGHASGDENSRIHGGAAGDQTGREVFTRTWYSSPWDLVLRCKDPVKAEKMAKACEAACANNNIGYDQYQRNTLQTQAKACNWDLSKVKVKCECDCSSLMTVCAQCAGIDVPYISGNAPYTGNMRNQFMSTGEFEALTESKYLSSDRYLKRGDILVRTSGHTAMALENGSNSNTNNANSTNNTSATGGTKVTVTVYQLKVGSKGENVKALQILLNGMGYNCGDVDGDFGSKTLTAVKKFQKANGLNQDGIVGKDTWTALLN